MNTMSLSAAAVVPGGALAAGLLRSEGRGRRGQRESAVRSRSRGGRAVRPRSGCAAEDVVVAPVRERVVEHRRPDSEISQADEKPGVSEVEYDERSGREPGEVAECPRDQADADPSGRGAAAE